MENNSTNCQNDQTIDQKDMQNLTNQDTNNDPQNQQSLQNRDSELQKNNQNPENNQEVQQNYKIEEEEEEKKLHIVNHPESSQFLTIVPIGGTGVGKSTFCNVLLDGYNSNRFKSSDSVEGGETKIITYQDGYALGGNKTPIRVYDIPGIADPELPLQDFIKQVFENLHGKHVDVVLIILKATDFRATLAQLISICIVRYIFEALVPKNVFIIFTRCDEYDIKENLLTNKIQSFQRLYGINLNYENVIRFYGNKTGLEAFVQKLSRSNYVINLNQEILMKMSQDINNTIQNLAKEDQKIGKQLQNEFKIIYQQESNNQSVQSYATNSQKAENKESEQKAQQNQFTNAFSNFKEGNWKELPIINKFYQSNSNDNKSKKKQVNHQTVKQAEDQIDNKGDYQEDKDGKQKQNSIWNRIQFY